MIVNSTCLFLFSSAPHEKDLISGLQKLSHKTLLMAWENESRSQSCCTFSSLASNKTPSSVYESKLSSFVPSWPEGSSQSSLKIRKGIQNLIRFRQSLTDERAVIARAKSYAGPVIEA